MTDSPSNGNPAGPTESRHEHLAFVLNIGRLVGADSFTLAPGHTLRRATPDEQEYIRDVLTQLPSTSPWQQIGIRQLWELAWPEFGATLPSEEWRYFVIAFRGNNDTINQFDRCFAVTEPEIEIGFTALQNPLGVVGARSFISHPGRFFQAVRRSHPPDPHFFIEVSSSEVEQIIAVHRQLATVGESFPWLQRAVSEMAGLRELPRTSPMAFLGMFAILESLLTHPPKQTDPYDSITRQVKKKLTLLNHRMSTPLSYAAFGDTTHDRVWGKMYHYRSALAHGGDAEFKNDLRPLKDRATAQELLRSTLKAVIRQGLQEPQLLADLREC